MHYSLIPFKEEHVLLLIQRTRYIGRPFLMILFPDLTNLMCRLSFHHTKLDDLSQFSWARVIERETVRGFIEKRCSY